MRQRVPHSGFRAGLARSFHGGGLPDGFDLADAVGESDIDSRQHVGIVAQHNDGSFDPAEALIDLNKMLFDLGKALLELSETSRHVLAQFTQQAQGVIVGFVGHWCSFVK
jgi:hypothetical protein